MRGLLCCCAQVNGKTVALHLWPPGPMEGVTEPGPLPHPLTHPEPAPLAAKGRLERTASGSKRRRNEGDEEAGGSGGGAVLEDGEEVVLAAPGDSSDEEVGDGVTLEGFAIWWVM